MIQTAQGSQPLTYAQFKARKKRREVTHPIVTDDDAVKALKAAKERLRVASGRNNKAELAAAEAEVADCEQAVRDATLVTRLRALPRKGDGSFAALKSEHPPTAEDHKTVQEATGDPKGKATWHGDTFGPALVAACLIEPEVTVDEATEMSTDFNEAEWDNLMFAAIQVNQQQTDTAGLVFS